MNSGNTFKQLSLKEIIAQQTKTNDEDKQWLDTNESSLKDIYNKMDFLLTAFDEQNTVNPTSNALVHWETQILPI